MDSRPITWPRWLTRCLTPGRHKLLHAQADCGNALDDSNLRELWSLRCRIFQLKSEIDREADWLWFRDTVRSAPVVWRYFSEDGRLVGFWEHRPRSLTIDGAPVLVLIFTFTFFERDYRGHPLLMATAARTLIPLVLRSLSAPLIIVGVGYPPSWMSLTRRGARVEADGESPADGLLQRVLHKLRAEVTGVDTDSPQPIVRMNTIPEPPTERWLARHHDDPELHRYEALNPRWREGFGLYNAALFGWRNLLSLAQTTLLRRQQ